MHLHCATLLNGVSGEENGGEEEDAGVGVVERMD